jgi:hypothetical protein
MNRRRRYGRALADAGSDAEPADALAKRFGLSIAQERLLRACVAGATAYRRLTRGTVDNLFRRELIEWATPDGAPPTAAAVTGYVRGTPLGADVVRQLDALRAAVKTGR